MDTCLECLDWITLVVLRRSWASKIENTVYLQENWERNVMSNYFKIWVIQKMSDILFTSSIEIIQTNNFMALPEQGLT
jgi:hypothetical protein